jgi:preprotein translocase subunit SecF
MGKRSKRRQEHKIKKAINAEKNTVQPDQPKKVQVERKATGWRGVYEYQYKKLLIIPFVILLAALIQIGMQQATTGDFISKDVSLKGGITITIPSDQAYNIQALEASLGASFPEATYTIRQMSSFGDPIGIVISSDIASADREGLITYLVEETGVDRHDISIEEIGSSLGSQFFKQTLFAILIAFIFMGIVVFLYFKTVVPSGAVILSAFSDMVVTVAIVNLLGMRISTAGIAAFLMLIGYSVDTDILLTMRVLKNKEGSVMERIYSAIKTGLTMNMTTLAAVTVAFFLSESEVLKQIMTILFIGLLVDMINTWIQNVGIIRWYVEKKHHE